MDPITAAFAIPSALKIIYSVSHRLQRFAADVSEIQDSLDGLGQELNSIETLLTVLEHSLSPPQTSRPGGESKVTIINPVLEALAGILQNCENTLERFSLALNGLGAPQASRSVAKKVVLQVRLDWKKEHIDTCRSQLQTHLGLVNVAVQLFNHQTTVFGTSHVIENLRPEIDKIIARLEQISPTSNESEFTGTEDSLQKSADILVTHAKSIAARSEPATSAYGGEGEAASQYTPDMLGWQPLVTKAMTVPSALVLGTEGLPHTPAIPNDSESDDDSDSFCAVDRDIIENYLVRGRETFENKDYAGAKRILITGIGRAKALPDNMRNDDEIRISELRLADCFFHLNELNEAKSHLELMIQQCSSPKPSVYELSAQHLLAQVLFRQGELEKAKACCKLNLSRKRFKSDLPEKFNEAAALMSNILSASGNSDEAKAYEMLISPARRDLIMTSSSSPPWDAALSPTATSITAGSDTLSRGSDTSGRRETAPSDTSAGLPAIDSVVAGMTRQFSTTSVKPSPASSPAGRRFSSFSSSFRRSSSGVNPVQLCKGTEAIKKQGIDDGMKLDFHRLPADVYERYRTCKSCKFRSAPWNPNDTRMAGDAILQNGNGIRYKWSFLATAHVACKTRDTIPTYKCVICEAEACTGDPSRTEEDLIEHIAIDHVSSTSLGIQKKTGCFFNSAETDISWKLRTL